MERFVPIRPLGHGAFGGVYLAYHVDLDIVAVKLIKKNRYHKQEREWNSAIQLTSKQDSCPFILQYKEYDYNRKCDVIITEYANFKTLDIITKQPDIPLPTYTLRALMKQILEGTRIIHASGLVHRDIKCDNILLHSPPGTGRVYVKIADFGLAKSEDQNSERFYIAGTLPYWV
ncbi:MAG: hypothetical protein EZS28_014654 [Streblomastix strix]|uniref:Protein kinase domain-containing protein n=1 Tax=Streblomastix strix TaxID=222440 RepID=A0A5J4W4P2_9EUKA|nr:MAG: hypothetical protein EZS28_014654 [Streblomastix strix]